MTPDVETAPLTLADAEAQEADVRRRGTMRRSIGVAMVVAACLSVAAVGTAGAQEKPTTTTFGFGLQTCGSFMEARRVERDLDYIDWLSGFLSAVNWSRASRGLVDRAGVTAGTDLAGPLGWLDNYCRANPLDSFAAATVALTNELIGRQGERPR
jgi:hypothetical protein